MGKPARSKETASTKGISMTPEDLAFVAKAIAIANAHPAPDEYVAKVLEAANPAPVAPIEGVV